MATSHITQIYTHWACIPYKYTNLQQMLSTVKLKLSSPPLLVNNNSGQLTTAGNLVSDGRRCSIRLTRRQLASISVQSENDVSSSAPLITSNLNSTVGSSSLSSAAAPQLSQRHIHILSFIACAAAISATWLFVSAIPTLLAVRRAAESLEKLMDVTREELPDTMAAVRLSGMEISDLTMELSDIGQGLTQGVRSSTRAVRLAEERLRQFSSTPQSGSTSPNGDQDSSTSFS